MYLYIYLYGTWLIHTKKNICNKPYVFIYILIHHTSSVWTSRTFQNPSRCYIYNITWLQICKIDYTVLLHICNRIHICTHLPYLQYTRHLHTFAKSERHYTFAHTRHIYHHIYNRILICHICNHISNTLRICTQSPHLQYAFATFTIISATQYTFAQICGPSVPYLQDTTHLHTFAKSERHYTFAQIRHIYNHIYNTIHICTHLCHIYKTLRTCTHSTNLKDSTHLHTLATSTIHYTCATHIYDRLHNDYTFAFSET